MPGARDRCPAITRPMTGRREPELARSACGAASAQHHLKPEELPSVSNTIRDPGDFSCAASFCARGGGVRAGQRPIGRWKI